MRKRMQGVLAERGGAVAEPGAAASEPGRPVASWPAAEPFRIGSVEIANRVIQAPLAGIANWAFRAQSRRHGAGATVSEMIASHGLFHGNRRTTEMLAMAPGERPLGVQLFGADPAIMAEAARAVAAAGADWIDINMGCPVSKVCKTGAGAALLADPVQGAAVIAAMVAAVDVPVTVKMRRGTTPADARPTELARRFEAAGAAAICFHPRAAAEEYRGRADHAITADVVAAIDVPVIASGDLLGPADVAEVLARTGCAAVAIGRAALGNPWVFGAMTTGAPLAPPTRAQTLDELRRFAIDAAAALGVGRSVGYLRKFYPWYLAVHRIPRDAMGAALRAPTVDSALAEIAGALHGAIRPIPA